MIGVLLVVTAYVVFFVVAWRRAGARELANKDLREVYPPVRDRLHRDLERLNKLRGEPADAKRPEPGRAVPELVIRAGDDPAAVLRAHRRQLVDEWCEIEAGRRRRLIVTRRLERLFIAAMKIAIVAFAIAFLIWCVSLL